MRHEKNECEGQISAAEAKDRAPGTRRRSTIADRYDQGDQGRVGGGSRSCPEARAWCHGCRLVSRSCPRSAGAGQLADETTSKTSSIHLKSQGGAIPGGPRRAVRC